MQSPRVLLLLFTLSICVTGCQVERGPTQEQIAVQKNNDIVSPHFVAPPQIDDANLLIQHCGPPSSDAVLPIYDKLDNGPVRRIVYTGRRVITFDFIPSHPNPRVTSTPAPFPHAEAQQPALPANSVWRFDEARLPEAELLTTTHMGVFLPCAAQALHREY